MTKEPNVNKTTATTRLGGVWLHIFPFPNKSPLARVIYTIKMFCYGVDY